MLWQSTITHADAGICVVLGGGSPVGRTHHGQPPNTRSREFFWRKAGVKGYISDEAMEAPPTLCQLFFDERGTTLEGCLPNHMIPITGTTMSLGCYFGRRFMLTSR